MPPQHERSYQWVSSRGNTGRHLKNLGLLKQKSLTGFVRDRDWLRMQIAKLQFPVYRPNEINHPNG